MNDWFPDLARQEIERQAGFAVVDVFDELPSTSDHALANLTAYSQRLPAVIVARRQTQGRGRGSRSWFAGDGALTFTAMLGQDDTPVVPSNWPRCSLIAGVAMCQTLEALTESDGFQLKWPNDVYLSGRKVCGILVEKRDAAEPVLCVGIGVNVNNSLEDAPTDVQQRAIAMTDVTGQQHFLPEILLGFLTRFRELCGRNVDCLTDLLPYWRTHCLLTGRAIETRQADKQIAGECHGIDPSGALLVETSAGERQIVSGEIIRW
ncbi:biotin--[acetyl-CoA-carboxylase] ligase [Bremerella alba]|uniref:biotin--[biotin carboxyl-carrier protein] ligase n=1 Tax=Bremerella alba TaxID=980252 RepID=A0A7V8VAH5_9BACT|nr:biotin--[acetyl-CoA-carboxylase] ligase [Bremerella alba]MBA2117699.1 Bifunctional ligase/repressor BirA [Bremerella alba]